MRKKRPGEWSIMRHFKNLNIYYPFKPLKALNTFSQFASENNFAAAIIPFVPFNLIYCRNFKTISSSGVKTAKSAANAHGGATIIMNLVITILVMMNLVITILVMMTLVLTILVITILVITILVITILVIIILVITILVITILVITILVITILVIMIQISLVILELD